MNREQMDDMDRLASRLCSNLQSTWEACVYGAIEELQDKCESPIEVMLGAAILLGGLLSDGPGKVGKPYFALHTAGDIDLNPAIVVVVPQYKWNSYRIDFALLSRNLEQPVFVECDGHDFHERTKEQAARDRSKDRAIQQAGIPVLRFTGSEIYKDAARCVEQIIRVVANRAVASRHNSEN